MDVTPASIKSVYPTEKVKKQLLKISLFDLWICNEDRNSNNANLLYNILDPSLVAIDHGCIFNTAGFDCGLSLLTCNETILESPLAQHILGDVPIKTTQEFVVELEQHFRDAVLKSQRIVGTILDSIPLGWGIPIEIVEEKILQLFDEAWAGNCWEVFIDYMKENGYV